MGSSGKEWNPNLNLSLILPHFTGFRVKVIATTTPLKLICTFIIFLTFTRFAIIVNDIYHNSVYDEL